MWSESRVTSQIATHAIPALCGMCPLADGKTLTEKERSLSVFWWAALGKRKMRKRSWGTNSLSKLILWDCTQFLWACLCSQEIRLGGESLEEACSSSEGGREMFFRWWIRDGHGWSCVKPGDGLDDPCGSLPTLDSLWFYGMYQFNLNLYGLYAREVL